MAVNKRRVLLSVAALLIFLGAGGTALYWYFDVNGYVSTDDAHIDGNSVNIGVAMLGRVARINAGEGDSVKQGEQLVSLATEDLKARLAQAKASVKAAEGSLSLASLNLSQAEKDFERQKQVYERGVTSTEQYDHARHAYQVAQAQLSISQAQVDSARAQEQVTEQQLADSAVSAPFSGVVAKRWVEPGAIVQPGQAILTLDQSDPIWVTANIEETKLASISPGESVDIAVDAYPRASLSGKVLSIGAATAATFSLLPPSNASGNFTKITQRVPVKISIETNHDDLALLPGMSVSVRIHTR